MRISHILRISDENEICINVWDELLTSIGNLRSHAVSSCSSNFSSSSESPWNELTNSITVIGCKKTTREENLISYSTFGTTVRRACLNILVFVQAWQCAVMHGSKEWGDSEKNFYHSTLGELGCIRDSAMELQIEICCIKQLRIFLRNSVMIEMVGMLTHRRRSFMSLFFFYWSQQ